MTATASYNTSFTLAGIATIAVLLWVFAPQSNAVDYASTARGVDVYIVSDTNVVMTGQTVTADVFITNDQTPLNVMEVEVVFDPQLIAVTDFQFGNSLCEERFIIDNTIDNELGRLHMSCGTITPFTGNATVFGTIVATPLTSGITTLDLGQETHVYVHDGYGTEIARDTYGATLSVEAGV